MTSNKTTELLRKGLAEHGIEWRSGLEGVTFVGNWCFVEYDSGKLAATCEPVLTPEQAIAATLGSGTLTADDVLDAVYKHGARWQAIADELNSRAERTCKPTEEDCCPYCGEDLVRCNVGIGEGGGAIELDPPIYHNYCPNCGRKVEA